MKSHSRFLFRATSALLLVAACSSPQGLVNPLQPVQKAFSLRLPNDLTTPGNSPPFLQALSSSPSTFTAKSPVTFSAQGFDAETTNLTYTWSASKGSLSSTSGSSVTWTPEEKGRAVTGLSIVTVVVSDGQHAVKGDFNVYFKDNQGQTEVDVQSVGQQCAAETPISKQANTLVEDDILPPLTHDISNNLPSTAKIIIDGKADDWTGILPIAQDNSLDTGGQGDDIKTLYLAQDSTFLYYRIDTWNTPTSSQGPHLSVGTSGSIFKDPHPQAEEKTAEIIEGKIPLSAINQSGQALQFYVSAFVPNGEQIEDRTRVVGIIDLQAVQKLRKDAVTSTQPITTHSNSQRISPSAKIFFTRQYLHQDDTLTPLKLFSINGDGTDEREIPLPFYDICCGEVSKSGEFIVFAAVTAKGQATDIYKMNTSDLNPIKLVDAAHRQGAEIRMSLVENDTKLVFESSELTGESSEEQREPSEKNLGLYYAYSTAENIEIINIDGSNRQKLSLNIQDDKDWDLTDIIVDRKEIIYRIHNAHKLSWDPDGDGLSNETSTADFIVQDIFSGKTLSLYQLLKAQLPEENLKNGYFSISYAFTYPQPIENKVKIDLYDVRSEEYTSYQVIFDLDTLKIDYILNNIQDKIDGTNNIYIDTPKSSNEFTYNKGTSKPVRLLNADGTFYDSSVPLENSEYLYNIDSKVSTPLIQHPSYNSISFSGKILHSDRDHLDLQKLIPDQMTNDQRNSYLRLRNTELYAINPDGSDPQRITKTDLQGHKRFSVWTWGIIE